MKKNYTGYILALLTTISLSLAGCGGGGGGGTSTATPAATQVTVSGVAATGAPMSGTVYLKDAAGNPEMSTTINPQTGAFMFNVSGKTPPFMIRAGSLYSMSGGSGTANINPLSNLMVANTAGFRNMSTMNSFYANPNGTTMQTMYNDLSTARQQMWQTMGTLLTAYGVANVDPISSPYTIGQGLDLMFDNVQMTIDQYGNVTMMNTSGSTIYTGPMGNISGGTMMSGNITGTTGTGTTGTGTGGTGTGMGGTGTGMGGTGTGTTSTGTGGTGTGTTVTSVTITPGNASLKVNGTQQFSANIPVTWSVVGLNSGSITAGGLYTAPPYQGMFLVKATSTADPTQSATVTVLVGSSGMMM